MTSASTARAQLLRMEPAPQIVQVDRYAHAPQWQARLRFSVGSPGAMRGHGTAYVSNEVAELLVQALLTCGVAVRIFDRSDPASPKFYRSADKQPHPDERAAPRDE